MKKSIHQLECDLEYEKKEYKEFRKNHQDCWKKWDKAEQIFGCIMAMFITTLVIALILLCAGAFDEPRIELGISRDIIAKDYVTKYYPEYSKCIMKYNGCVSGGNFNPCKAGVEIFCDVIDQRDGLRPIDEGKSPDHILEFDNLDIDQIFKDKVRGCF